MDQKRRFEIKPGKTRHFQADDLFSIRVENGIAIMESGPCMIDLTEEKEEHEKNRLKFVPIIIEIPPPQEPNETSIMDKFCRIKATKESKDAIKHELKCIRKEQACRRNWRYGRSACYQLISCLRQFQKLGI